MFRSQSRPASSGTRFSLLLVDEGEYYFDDYAASRHTVETFAGEAEDSQQKGRLRVLSHSVIFEPEDESAPLVKLKFGSCELKEHKEHSEWDGSQPVDAGAEALPEPVPEANDEAASQPEPAPAVEEEEDDPAVEPPAIDDAEFDEDAPELEAAPAVAAMDDDDGEDDEEESKGRKGRRRGSLEGGVSLKGMGGMGRKGMGKGMGSMGKGIKGGMGKGLGAGCAP